MVSAVLLLKFQSDCRLCACIYMFRLRARQLCRRSCLYNLAETRVTEQNNGLSRKKNNKCNLVFINIELAASRFSHWQQLHLGSFKFS